MPVATLGYHQTNSLSCIYPDKITSVSSHGAEVGSLVAENMLDDYLYSVFRHSDGYDEIQLTCATGSQALGIYNASAHSISVTVTNVGASVTYFSETEFNMREDSIEWKNLWIDYGTTITATHIVTIKAWASDNVKIGIVREGPTIDLAPPKRGFTEETEDLSVRHGLINGGIWSDKFRSRDRISGIALRSFLSEDSFEAFQNLTKTIGSRRLAWKLSKRPEHLLFGAAFITAWSFNGVQYVPLSMEIR